MDTPFRADLDPKILAQSKPITVPAGTQIFGPGDVCDNFLVVLDGSVRVEHVSESGRTLVLYRVRPGESCIMTTSALLSNNDYAAYGLAEGEVRALAMPKANFGKMVQDYHAFRTYAFDIVAGRMVDLVAIIDDLLVRKIDVRLAGWLLEQGQTAVEIRTTHQAIAHDIGSAREVVSRLLKEFERRGLVALARGSVCLTDRVALQRLALSGRN